MLKYKLFDFIATYYLQCFMKIRLQNGNPWPEQSMNAPAMNGKV